MSITFIHTADWQLGRRFKRMASDTAARLEAARLDAIDRIGELGGRVRGHHVLVAGDVFDSEQVGDGVLRGAMSRMASWGAIRWHLLPGNHDLARPSGVWERVARLGVPANVRLHLTAEGCELEPGVALLTAPLVSRSSDGDPTGWMDTWATATGTIRIGLAHGSVQGFGSLGEAAQLIDPGRRLAARLDYLALGDWHGTREIAAGVWYAGTPEPDRFVGNDSGNALVVDIAAAGAPAKVEAVRVGTYTWLAQRLIMTRVGDLEPIERSIETLGPAQSRHLLRLNLEGGVAASEVPELEERLARLEARLMSLEVDRSRLGTSFRSEDLERLGEAGKGLRAVAERLALRAREDDGSERVAERALTRLLTLAAGGDQWRAGR